MVKPMPCVVDNEQVVVIVILGSPRVNFSNKRELRIVSRNVIFFYFESKSVLKYIRKVIHLQ